MTTDKAKIPNLGDDAAYAAGSAKLAELQTELARLSGRRDAVLVQMDTASAPSRRADSITAAALKLLGGADSKPGANASGLREELAVLDQDLAVHVEAIRIQREHVAGLGSEASKRIIAAVLPRHRELVREIAKRILALDEALGAEHDLREALLAGDIMLGELCPMPLSYHGLLRDPYSRAAGYLIESCARNFLDLDDLPQNLRELARAKKAPARPPTALRTVKKAADGWIG